MKFTITHAGNKNYAGEIGKLKEIDINSLEELRDFAMQVNETLVIKFSGVTSNAWHPYGKTGDTEKEKKEIQKEKDEQTIKIYDNYIE